MSLAMVSPVKLCVVSRHSFVTQLINSITRAQSSDHCVYVYEINMPNKIEW